MTERKWLDMNHPLELRQADTLLGILNVEYVDQPLFVCTFTPCPAFEQVRPIFNAYALRARQGGPAILSPEEIHALRLRLVAVNGEIADFFVNIDGERAFFTRHFDTVTFYDES